MLSPDLARILHALPLVALLCALSGCYTTTYRPYDTEPTGPALLERQVAFEVKTAFYEAPGDCIVVLPLQGLADQPTRETVEAALARHLTERVSRVIAPAERRRRARHLGLDLEDPAAWPHFAAAADCPRGLAAGLTQSREDYLLFWAQHSLGLEAAVLRLEDRQLLWRARHTGQRSDGGLPLSPLSLAVETVSASGFALDDEVRPALADEVARRLLTALPDLR